MAAKIEEFPAAVRHELFWRANDESYHPPETIGVAIEVSENTLSNWRTSGKGPVYRKFGKLVYYKKADIMDWLSSIPTSRPQAA